MVSLCCILLFGVSLSLSLLSISLCVFSVLIIDLTPSRFSLPISRFYLLPSLSLSLSVTYVSLVLPLCCVVSFSISSISFSLLHLDSLSSFLSYSRLPRSRPLYLISSLSLLSIAFAHVSLLSLRSMLYSLCYLLSPFSVLR